MRRITPGGAKRFAGRKMISAGVKLAELDPAIVQHHVPTAYPAGFENWLRRRNDRLTSLFPSEWRMREPSTVPAARVAVVVHVFYAELVPEILHELQHLPVEFDLIVTNATGVPLELDTSSLDRVGRVEVYEVNNQGRDILPLVSLVNADILEPYELVLKIHTKRSAWRAEHTELSGTGDEWRRSLYAGLLGSPEHVESILSAFAGDPSLGLLTADGNLVGPEFWGGDQQIVEALLKRLQLELEPETLHFASGSVYWVRGFILQGLRALQLSEWDFEAEAGQVDATTAHGIERLIGIVTEEAGYDLREVGSLTASSSDVESDGWKRFRRDAEVAPRARAVPFYLPQFHAFPENDQWWGTGFTEWSNVAGAQAIYEGQNQPLLPSDFGFYDLRAPGTRRKQYDLAQSMGIEGFMYYYYWFAGKKLMNLPVEQLVADSDDEPFCIMWANENFTRRWDGRSTNVLIGQDYERVPATQFIHDVIDLLTDDRYIRVDGRPVLGVYRITQIPEYRSVVAYWRQVAREAGLDDLLLLSVDVSGAFDGVEGDLSEHGMDAYMEFAPHNKLWSPWDRADTEFDDRFQGNTFRYDAMVENAELTLLEGVSDDRYPGVMVNYDNTARRQWQPDLWWGSNPYTFRRWFDAAVSAVADRDREHRLVFVNAWNEWAESAVLEPTLRFGKSYLMAIRDVLYR